MNLVVVGSLGLDDVTTPFGSVEGALGGSATYFAAASSYFAPTGMVGVVGEDFPESGLDFMRKQEIDLQGLEIAEGRTFRWAGKYHFDMNDRDTLLTELNVFENFRPTLPDDYKSAKYLFLGNIAPELQLKVLDQIDDPRFVAMDTMNFWISGAREALGEVLKRVDILMINDSEARELAQTPNIVKAAQIISGYGPKFLVIKRGEYGAFLYHKDRFFFTPAFPLAEVIDPTGAGDSFAGGFMGHVALMDDISWSTLCNALIAGSTMASFCVESFSIERLEALTNDEIDRRSFAFRSLTEVVPLD